MPDNAQIKVQADDLTDDQLIGLAENYKKGLTDHPLRFTDGAAYITAITPLIAGAKTNVQALKDHKQARAVLVFTKDQSIAALLAEVKRGGRYVALTANGNPVVMTEGGFGVRDAGGPPVITAPTGLNATFGDLSGSIDLHWNPVENGISYIVHYRVANQNGPWLKSNPVTASQHRLTGLTPGELYELSVCAVFSSEYGNSPTCATIEHRSA